MMAIKWGNDRANDAKTIIHSRMDWIMEQRALGRTLKSIAEEIGVSLERLGVYVNPARYERELRVNKERKRIKSAEERIARPRTYQKLHDAVVKIEVLGELPPPDTRDLTARFMGDPLPGRSYLDRMKQQGQRD